jgi:hypothetical protein
MQITLKRCNQPDQGTERCHPVAANGKRHGAESAMGARRIKMLMTPNTPRPIKGDGGYDFKIKERFVPSNGKRVGSYGIGTPRKRRRATAVARELG